MAPVWHVGERVDNARSSGIFAGVANVLNKRLCVLPFAFASPEWGNEKGIGASLGFRLLGVNLYRCVEAQIHGSRKVIEIFEGRNEGGFGFRDVCRRRPGRARTQNRRRLEGEKERFRLELTTK
ncbi:MAG: hypothetical protein IKK39_10450 [Thermoguttaceae bacterium]|nr:hypothetical protein [Thermoguttaceae bacterium]MBR4104465.1 hypothetical protein [Thermoguttaceae bacterium]